MSAVFFRSKMLTRNLNYTCTICWLLEETAQLTLVSCHLALCAVTPFVGFRLPGGSWSCDDLRPICLLCGAVINSLRNALANQVVGVVIIGSVYVR